MYVTVAGTIKKEGEPKGHGIGTPRFEKPPKKSQQDELGLTNFALA
jgi:hypothetical protein